MCGGGRGGGTGEVIDETKLIHVVYDPSNDTETSNMTPQPY